MDDAMERDRAEFILQHFGIPPVDLAPGKCLKVIGHGKERLVSTHNFFVLAAGAGWVGNMTIKCRPRRSHRAIDWEITYRGPWVKQYGDLLINNKWPERIFIADNVPEVEGS